MKAKTLRVVIPLVIMAVIAVGFYLNTGVGTLSAIGWGDISLLCPLGALTTMLASKAVVPRAVISLVVAVVGIVLLGRAFCAWACPVPVVSKLRGLFSKPSKGEGKDAAGGNAAGAAAATMSDVAAAGMTSDATADADNASSPAAAPLSDRERALLSKSSGCASCREKRGAVDSRHFVLGGALLSAAVFGFPVFCLVCPIGLTFATILLVMLLFSNGDVTWSVVVIPALLLVEVVFFRKWCTKLCPLSALMSLVGKANRTFRPTVNESVCLETKGATCGKCSAACEEGIDPRHPELGASWSECTKCRACVDACPTHAITMPLLPKKQPATPTLEEEPEPQH